MAAFVAFASLMLITLLPFRQVISINPYQERVEVDLDIAEQRQKRIGVFPSTRYPGGTNYTISHYCRHTHIIGSVKDGGTLIDSVDQESMSKYVLTLPGPDNSMFVRISNRYRRRLGGFTSKIREFIRKPGRRSYERVEKRYIDLEILAQAAHEYIKVELFIPREDDPGEGTSSQAEGTVLGSRIWEDGGTGPRFLSTLYSIKTEMLPYFSIGVIKYGGYILEDDTENLLEKDVLWEGRAGAPRITVTALYSDGIETKTIHWFKYGTWYSYRERVSQCKVMR